MLSAIMKSLGVVVCLAVLAFGGTTTPQQVFEQASAALKSGDYAAAESGFQQVLRRDPQSLGALGNLGVVYSHTHRYGKAIEVYRRALRFSPNDNGILLNLGLAYLKKDDYTNALPFFRRLHANDPGNAQAFNLLATCLVFGGNPKAALDLLQAASEKDPDPATLYLLGVAYSRTGQREAGKEIFARMLTSSGTHSQGNFLLGKAYYDSDLFQEAESAYKDVIRSDAAFPGVHRELGKVYISLRRNDLAQQELHLALQQDQQDESAGYFLGALLVQIGQYSEGAAYLEKAHALNADSWAACFYLGKAKLKLRDPDAAIGYLKQAADMNPSEATIFYLLGTALRSVGRKEEANAAFQQVTKLHTSELDAAKRTLEDAHVVGAH